MHRFLRQFLALILGGMIIASGFVYIYFYLNNNNPVNNKISLHVPDSQELNLSAGLYTVFYAYATNNLDLGPIHLSKYKKAENLSSILGFQIINASDHSDTPITADITASYTMKHTKAESLYRFKINRSGLYSITIQFRNSKDNTAISLTLIRNFNEFLLGAFKAIGIAVLIALPFLLVGWYCYVRENKRLRPVVSKNV